MNDPKEQKLNLVQNEVEKYLIDLSPPPRSRKSQPSSNHRRPSKSGRGRTLR